MEDGEKEDTAKEEEQAEALWADVTKRKKRRCGQKVEKTLMLGGIRGRRKRG